MYSLLGFLLTVGILIIIHELGHYLVARWCNVKVLRFSFGFGPVLLSRRFGRDKTEWVLSAVPLGGYVRMLDLRDRRKDEPPITENELIREFSNQNVWKRIAIVAAGPMSNMLLAVLLLAVMFMAGISGSQPVLSQPAKDTPAAQAGLQSKDLILEVNGEPVTLWQDVNLRILDSDMGSSAMLTVERDGQKIKVSLPLSEMKKDKGEGNQMSLLGLNRYLGAPVVREVSANSPAEMAGLKSGDTILSVDDIPLDEKPSAMMERFNQAAGMEVTLTVKRGDEHLSLQVIPDQKTDKSGETVGRIGVSYEINPEVRKRYEITVRHQPVDAIVLGVTRTWDFMTLTFKMIGRMLTGSASLKNLSGPLTIADFAGQSIQTGFQQFMTFLALISIGIGVLNLLPVPLLDGGHLLYYVAEIIRGRPLSARIIDTGQQVGLVLIFLLIALALLNDFSRFF